MTSLELIDDGEDLERDLENELLKRDVKNVLSYVTPYIPLVGLVFPLSHRDGRGDRGSIHQVRSRSWEGIVGMISVYGPKD